MSSKLSQSELIRLTQQSAKQRFKNSKRKKKLTHIRVSDPEVKRIASQLKDLEKERNWKII